MELTGPPLKPTVLVVEDETLTRLNVAASVEAAGFCPLAVCDAAEAVQVLEARDDIRAVVTDVQMPGSMDGLGLIRLVMDRWPGVVPLVTSGKTSILDALPKGVQLIPKPCLASQIVAALRQLIV